MKQYGLIGKNVSASLSPQIHQAFFETFNIAGGYDLISLKEEESDIFFQNLKKKSYDGFNITHPYKKKILFYLDECSEEAKKTGAVNTVFIRDGKSLGYNTDVEGFFLSLPECLKKMEHPKILLLGAGGSAHAVWTALSKLNTPTVHLYNRTEKHAREMVETLHAGQSNSVHTVLIQLKDLKMLEDESYDMIINATTVPFTFSGDENSVFFHRNLKNRLKKKGILYDIKYGIEEDRFRKEAEKHDIIYMDGRTMLYYQALYAHVCWGNASQEILKRELTDGIKLKCCFSTTKGEENRDGY